MDANNLNDNLIIINDSNHPRAKWYIVHTYSGHENRVAQTLKSRAEIKGFTDKIFKVFIPSQEKVVVSEGKKRKVKERLFPGYVYINMLLDEDSWAFVRNTQGITGFIGSGATPTPLPENEVVALMKYVVTETPKFEMKYQEGDSVKITEGPFADSIGRISEVNDDQGKVKVLVSFFGKEVPIELEFSQITSL
ncbi:MAG: transcription termination/antitermination factor NusG [Proteobacteria bacterium]|nr:transcription termination/antitermination factor NusG [Pseudomonadota bacterium]